jgi:ketosteroid isomerase-like protein
MPIRTLAVVLALAIAPVRAFAASGPSAPIVKLTAAMIRATNANDASALSGLFTADAVIVDENPPFVWRGAGAAAAWWHVVEAVTKKAQLTHFQATVNRNGEFRQSATDAYLVQSLTISGLAAGKPFSESGTLTYTFHDAGGTWLISTMVWTTKP